MNLPRPRIFRRLAGLLSGAGWTDVEEEAAYGRAAREAFQSGSTFEARSPSVPVQAPPAAAPTAAWGTSGPFGTDVIPDPAPVSMVATTAPMTDLPPWPGIMEVPAGPTDEPGEADVRSRPRPMEPAATTAAILTSETWDPRRAAPALALVPIVASDDGADVASTLQEAGSDWEDAVLDVDARSSRRQAGDTAPDFLMRVPPSVGATADAFFDGLVRRVESDR